MIRAKATSRAVGALFLAAMLFYGSGFGVMEAALGAADYLPNVLEDTQRVIIGAILMLVNSLVVAAIGVLAYPILKHHSEPTALAYLVTRILEAALLTVGIISLLTLVPLSHEYAAMDTAGAESLSALATMAVEGNYFAYQTAMAILGVGSLFFCYVLYQARLVPRLLAVWGLVGYAGLGMGAVLDLFGFGLGLAFSIPGGLFEVVLGVWLIVKGFALPAVAGEPMMAALK